MDRLPPELPVEERELVRGLRQFITLRWVAVVGILVTAIIAQRVFQVWFPIGPVIGVSIAIALYNTLFLVLNERINQAGQGAEVLVRKARRFAYAQIFADLAALTVLLHFTGGVENPFYLYYIFHITFASILLPTRGSYLVTGVAIGLFAVLVLGEYAGLIPHVELVGFGPSGPSAASRLYRQPAYVAAVLFAFVTAFGILTLGATAIVGELRKRRQEVIDLKDQLAAEAQALEAANARLRELDQMKNFFIGVAAHDLKAPLDAVGSLLNVILGGYTGELTERQRSMLERANLRLEELAVQVDDFLDVSLIESGRMVVDTKRMQLLEVVDRCLEDVAVLVREAEVEVAVETPGVLSEIQGEPRRLQQVLTNLITNGVKFTPPGGLVTIRVTDHLNHLQIDVTDTGVGISPEDLPHVFETFYRAKKTKAIQGTGLGLTIARRIVEEHGGRIWVESPITEDQRGSKFSFTLPKSLSERAVEVVPTPGYSSGEPGSGSLPPDGHLMCERGGDYASLRTEATRGDSLVPKW